MRTIDHHYHRATLLERAAAYLRLIAIASDSDQRALLEHVRDMWRALADECTQLSEEVLREQIQMINSLHRDILAMDSPSSRVRYPMVSEATIVDTNWTIDGRQFVNCNCSYGCPCQFNGLPTHGHCQAVAGMEIDRGHHGETKLDGLKFVGIFRWPGAIHEGKGEAAIVIDDRANEAQRSALLRILTGRDTEPGATIFSVLALTFEKLHDPIFATIDFMSNVPGRRGRLVVKDVTEGHGEPILNPVTGAEHRVRIDMVNGFEYTLAEIGRAWTKASHPIKFELVDSHAQFAEIHLCQSGIAR